jgi:hypothetical protein
MICWTQETTQEGLLRLWRPMREDCRVTRSQGVEWNFLSSSYYIYYHTIFLSYSSVSGSNIAGVSCQRLTKSSIDLTFLTLWLDFVDWSGQTQVIDNAGFINCLHHLFPDSITEQSMWAGSATTLIKAGTAPTLIQAAGKWSTDTFNCYICKSLFLFEVLLSGWALVMIFINTHFVWLNMLYFLQFYWLCLTFLHTK